MRLQIMAKSIPTEGTSITFQIPTLACLDNYCYLKNLSRSYVVQTAVQRYLAAEDADNNPDHWNQEYDKLEK
jgi:hypothetical protein